MSKSLAAKFVKGFTTSSDLAKKLNDTFDKLDVTVKSTTEKTAMSTIRNYRIEFKDGSFISISRVIKNPGFGACYTVASWQNGSGLRYKVNVLPKSF